MTSLQEKGAEIQTGNKICKNYNGEYRLLELRSEENEDDGRTETADVEEDNDNPECGFGPWKPRCAQLFNNPKGYLLILSIQGFMQNMITMGFLYMVISTLEKRFNLTSTSTGTMATCFDISTVAVVIFVTYFGERGNIPAWVGFGGLLFAAGAIMFAVPHFLTGLYNFEITQFDTCDANRTLSNECDPTLDESGLSKYLYVFIVANLLMGVGASPMTTLGITYLDENVMPGEFGFYVGIFNAASSLGPAVGFFVGNVFLNIYTDVRADQDKVAISSESPIWVGAWWLGFIVGGGIMVLSSTMLLGFPSKPPGAKQMAKNRKSEAQKGAEFHAREGTINSLRDFPYALLNLICNVPYMMLNGARSTEWFVITGLSVFLQKYLESQFNMTASTAAMYVGILTLISGVFGSLVGGWVMKRLKLNCLGQLKLSVLLSAFSLLFVFVFVIACDEVPMAGVTVAYNDSSVPIISGEDSNITASCNADCGCAKSFDPVCGVNDIMYYSACHAGCHEDIESEGNVKIYNNCTCVMESGITSKLNNTIHATAGRCGQQCQWQWVFMALMLGLLTIMWAAIIPSWTATMRCVSHSQRAFALALQTVTSGLLGYIPGPIVYGIFIDKSCLIWDSQCDGSATCWLYDNKMFAKSFLFITLTIKILSLLLHLGSVVFYKPDQEESDEDD